MGTERTPHSSDHGSAKGDTLAAQLATLQAIGRAPEGSPFSAVQGMRAIALAALRMGLSSLAQRAVESAEIVREQRLPAETALASLLEQLATEVRRVSDVALVRTAQEGISTVPAVPVATVARKSLLEQIHRSLVAGGGESVARQTVIQASGGYGKTAAALQYSAAYADEYPGGRFFRSVESGDIVAALASLTGPLRLASTNEANSDAALVAATLRDGPPSLLILDNVTSNSAWTAMLASGIVPGGNCQVLITTRAESIDSARVISIGRLSFEEAREVYKRSSESGRDAPSDHTADTITSLVGGLPVAVAAIAALMKLAPHLSWAEYALQLQNATIEHVPDRLDAVRMELGTGGASLPEHRRTHRVITDALQALPSLERRAIEYASLLPIDLTPAVWLETLIEADLARGSEPDLLGTGRPTDEPITTARAALRRLDQSGAIAPTGEDGKLLAVHPLWRASVRRNLEGQTNLVSQLWSSIALCLAARREVIVGRNAADTDRGVGNPAVLTDQSLRWELTPLAQMCAALWQAGQSGLAARVGVWLASVLLELGRYADAEACLQLTRENEAAVEAAIGHEELASCYSNLGAIQQAQGDLPGARASMERAIAINSKHFAPDHPTFATRYSNLALIQQDHGDLPGARASMNRAIAIDSKHFGPDHPNLATSYSNLALIQKAQGDLPGARASMERAIAIESKHFAPDHPTFATRYSNLALIQQAQGDLPGARASMERAIAINSKHFAPDHPTFGISYTNLATICYHEGDRAAACANFKKALAILLKHFDESHPQVKSVRKSMEIAGCGA